MGGPSLGRGESRGRRELAFDFEEGQWHSPGRWFEKEDRGPDASSFTSTQSVMNGQTVIRLRLFGRTACAKQRPSASASISFPNLSTAS
jgi:hypothetical protein